jgi:hypothetical protein
MIPELRAAILGGNQRMMGTLPGAGSNACCLVAVLLGEEPEDEKPRNAKENRDAQPIASQLHLSRTA